MPVGVQRSAAETVPALFSGYRGVALGVAGLELTRPMRLDRGLARPLPCSELVSEAVTVELSTASRPAPLALGLALRKPRRNTARNRKAADLPPVRGIL